MSHLDRRRGLTVVELMVVIFIIGVLMSLLVTAVQSSRESARRTQCLHKMREIGSAVLQFHEWNKSFPGWRHYPFRAWELTTTSVPYHQERTLTYATGWFPQLFAYMQRTELVDPNLPRSWTRPLVLGRYTYSWTPRMHQKLVCPSDVEKMADMAPRISFTVNAGRRDADLQPGSKLPADWRTNGVFLDLLDWRANPNQKVATRKQDISFIRGGDGLANTAMLSESLHATKYFDISETNMAFIFEPPTDGQGTWPTSFAAPYQKALPSSNHGGRVNMVFADGHGRLLDIEKMNYLVYCALLTPKGKAALEPGTTNPSNVHIRQQPKLRLDDLE